MSMPEAEEAPPVISANAARQLRATQRIQPEAAPAGTGIIAGAAFAISLDQAEPASGAAVESAGLAAQAAHQETFAPPPLPSLAAPAIEVAPPRPEAPQAAPTPSAALAFTAAPHSQSQAPAEAPLAPPPATLPEAPPAQAESTAQANPPSPELTRGNVEAAPPPPDSRIITRPAEGAEDDPLALEITLLDASQAVRILVSGLPPGARLSAGGAQPDGGWLLGQNDLPGLRLIPAADWSGEAVLRLRLHTGRAEILPGDALASLPVRFAAIADAPELTLGAASGGEDQAIALDLSAALRDTDGSEILSLALLGVPEGARLSLGQRMEDGSWSIPAGGLAGLTLTPPADFSGSIALILRGIATETANGSAATTLRSFSVQVDPVVDGGGLSASAAGQEDSAITLEVRFATSPDPSEAWEATAIIRGVPEDARLSQGRALGGGAWEVDQPELASGRIQLTPPADSDAEIVLTIEARITDRQGGSTSRNVTAALTLRVDGVADAPTITTANSIGAEDSAIRLTGLAAALTDTDGSETLSALLITGVPAEATLSHGTRRGDGSWSITPAQLAEVSLSPPRDFAGNIELELRATSTEREGGSATQIGRFTLTVTPLADAAIITGTGQGQGQEDSWITLRGSLATTDRDGSESFGPDIIIQDVPAGATLSHGVQTAPGSWTVPRNLFETSQLAIRPAADSDADFNLRITATTQDGQSRADTTASITVTVQAVADAPTITTANSIGAEDSAIRLTGLAAALTDTDGSETLSALLITGVPAEATLSHGTRRGDGSWSITPAQLAEVSLSPPRDFAGNIELELRATSTEREGGSATQIGRFTLTVTPLADAAIITGTGQGQGQEDSWITLRGSLATTDRDGSESFGPDIIIQDVPAGATLSHGVQTAPGSWTVPRNLFETSQLAIRPAADSDADFNLRITATTQDGQSRADTTASITVTVQAVADAPTITTANSIGAEDSAIRLTGLAAALTDTDGSETLSFVLSGVPSGATLSHGTRQGDGSWSLTPAQLAQLSLTPPAQFAGQIQLTLTAVATEAQPGVAAARRSASFVVTVDAVADMGRITGQSIGQEDAWVRLTPSFTTPDNDGSESWAATTRVTGLPPGAVLSQGSEVSPGCWNVTTTALRAGAVSLRGAANSDADITLGFETLLSDSANGRTDTRLVTGSVQVTIQAVADQPLIQAPGAAGLEDRAIALNLGAALTDTDGSETLSLRIEGVPAGAVLSHGTRQADGSWAVAPAELAALALTPPRDFSGAIQLTLEATASDQDGSRSVARQGFTVTVDAVADAPGLRVANAMGAEDSSIALRIAGWTTDADGSETLLGFRLLDVPADVGVSAGGRSLARSPDGSFWVPAADADTLRAAPPAHSDRDFALRVIAIAQEPNGSRAESAPLPLTVRVDAVADAPVWTHLSTTGREDQAIPLNLGAQLADADGSERLFFVIDGLPAGAVLDVGTYRGPGSWSLTAEEAARATITPPRDFSGRIALSVTAIAQEQDGGHQAMSRRDHMIEVAGVIDTKDDRGWSGGLEDRPIALDLLPRLGDRDGSERLVGQVEIAGVPGDATLRLADGRIIETKDGVAWIEVTQARGVTLGMAANSDAMAVLKITATVEDGGGTQGQVTRVLSVDARGVADAPSLTLGDGAPWSAKAAPSAAPAATEAAMAEPVAATAESDGTAQAKAGDAWLPLPIQAALQDQDGSERLHLWVRDVPEGFMLSNGIATGQGVWLLREEDLKGLAIRAPAGTSGTVVLRVQAVATEAEGDAAQTEGRLTLQFEKSDGSGGQAKQTPCAPPEFAIDVGAAREGEAARLSIKVALQDKEQRFGILIEGLSEGVRPSAGTYDPERKLWVLRAEDLDGLALQTPPHWAGGLAFKVSVIVVDTAGGTAEAVQEEKLWVEALSDGAALSATPGHAIEDQAIALNLTATALDRDGSEDVVSVILSDLPKGSKLLPMAGVTDRGDGSWQVEPWALGGVRLQPPANAHGSIGFTITATTSEASNGHEATNSRRITIEVAASPDAPQATAQDASGREDTAIALSLSAALVDQDGSEVLSLVLAGLPQGARLSAGINNGDGSWTLTPGQLPGLTITPPRDWSGAMALTLDANAMELSTGAVATTRTGFRVQVAAVADAPIGDVVASADGAEDQPIALLAVAQLTDRDGSETLHLVITGVPEGTRFSAGQRCPDGDWEVPGERMAGLTFTPPANFSGTLAMTVRVTAREADGSEAASVFPWNVNIRAVADAPVVSVAPASGQEDSAVALNLTASLTDTDGSESIAAWSLAGLPAGATLSAGQREADGSWSLTPAQITGLRLNPPADFAGQITLAVTAIAREGANGSEARGTSSLNVTVNAVADAPVVSVAPASGQEDSAIALNITATLADRDGSESIAGWILAGLPAGATLSAGQRESDGSWSLTPAQITGLRLNPPADFAGQITLAVTAIAREGANGSEARGTSSLNVTVNAVADAPVVSVAPASGQEDSAIALNITATLADRDGSESIAGWSLAGLPAGATLSAGQREADGSWSLTPAQITGLRLNPPADFAGQIILSVTAIAREGANGSEARSTTTLNVTVTAVADAPVVSVTPAPGLEDGAVALNLTAALVDRDGSEALQSLGITGLPAGFSLSAGTPLGGGAWALQPADLPGLTLRAPQDWHGSLALTLHATASEAGSSATASRSFNVTVSAVNDAPILTLAAAAAGAAEGEMRASLLGDAIAQDVDSALMSGATITLSGAAPAEALGFAGYALMQDSGRSMLGTTGIEMIQQADGGVVLRGAAPSATYAAVLESLMLETTDAAGLAAGERLIQITLRDDAGLVGTPQGVSLTVAPSILVGKGSDQILAGTAGDDRFIGSAEDETMLGGAGADLFVIAAGGGRDRVEGGDGSWLDRLNIEGAGGPGDGGWTLVITNQAAPSAMTDSLDFSEPASGQVLFADGGQVEFSGIERITW